MKLLPLALAALASIPASAAFAAEPPPSSSAPIVGIVRLLKADGASVAGQAIVAPGTLPQVGVRAADAVRFADGRCVFNLKIDEVSPVARSATVTRLYAHDALIASVGRLDLAARTLKSFVVQPALPTGLNHVKFVFDAESAKPTVAWVQVRVDGPCVAPPPPAPTPASAPPPPPVKPGSGDWNALFNAYGYSNYAVHGLAGKGFGGYDELVSVNAGLVAAVKAGSIGREAWQKLMARWNAIAGNADFKAAMAKVVPGGDRPV